MAGAIVNYKIYVIGGRNGLIDVDTAEMYDLATGSWQSRSSMPTPRSSLTANTVNGKIYAIGGESTDGSDIFATVEVYDPVNDTWFTKSSTPTEQSSIASGVVDGKIYSIGGYDLNCLHLNTVEVYDPAADIY